MTCSSTTPLCFLVLLCGAVAWAAPVTLDLFVASKCPDASRCENRFLPSVLRAVGDLVDLRLGFIGVPNSTAPFGVSCLHGDDECAGNVVQLCVQRHFPTDVGDDTNGLPKQHSWTRLLQCVGHFNHTSESRIPQNTDSCLSGLGVPEAVLNRIHACVRGKEGRALLLESVQRTQQQCGAHTSTPRQGCKSCSMFLNGERACVVDDASWYNCSAELRPQDGMSEDAEATGWVREICSRHIATATAAVTPLACRLLQQQQDSVAAATTAATTATATATATATTTTTTWMSGLPVISGHIYASTNPEASAAFAVRYFGAVGLRTITCNDTDLGTEFVKEGSQGPPGPPQETVVRLPSFSDFRGGGLEVRFVSNPRKPGGRYDIAAHGRAMDLLYGNLSDNTGHHWNQFFDSHLGFYVEDMNTLPRRLLADGVPFFTGLSNGLYESVYVVIPGTAKIVEILGDFDAGGSDGNPLPQNHLRISSTQQFCTPKRRRRRQLVGTAATTTTSSLRRGGWHVDVDVDFGNLYRAGDADTNKTTLSAADPDAAIDFAVRYLGAGRIQQHRAAPADGQCAKLAWAQWPTDQHQWHAVRASSADWVTIDRLRPAVPFNISDLATYVEELRDLGKGVYDQWLDYRDVFDVSDLDPIAAVLRADQVPFVVRARPEESTCSLLLDVPRNGLAVELRSSRFGAMEAECAAQPFDLCAAA